MRRLSFILNGLGFCLIYWGLEITLQLKNRDIHFTGWPKVVSNPDSVLMTLSIISIVLFMIAMGLKFVRLMNTRCLNRTAISYIAMITIFILSLGLDTHYWYLTLAIIIGVAGILSHPFRFTPSGSLETLLRFIVLSSMATHVLISTEVGRNWAVSLFILVEHSMNYMTILYSLVILPIIVAPLGLKLYASNSGYIFQFILGLVIPPMVISMVLVDGYMMLIILTSLLYMVTMVVMYGHYVRKLAFRNSGYDEITPETILHETTLNKCILYAILPDDVYHHIFNLNRVIDS